MAADANDCDQILADACLVRFTERLPDCRLLTLDADFERGEEDVLDRSSS